MWVNDDEVDAVMAGGREDPSVSAVCLPLLASSWSSLEEKRL